MSYHSWTTDGFGLCMDDIKINDYSGLWRVIDMDEELSQRMRKKLREEDGIDGADVENIDLVGDERLIEVADDCDGGYVGLAGILRRVLEKKENLYLCACDDLDGTDYLLYMPFYPWSFATDEEKKMTPEKLTDIFQKYISMFSDSKVVLDGYSVENGG